MPQKQDFAASAKDQMKLTKTKGSKHATEAGFCCLCLRPDETHLEQRQQAHLKEQDFAASDKDPMKPTKTKGSNLASEAGFCCLRRSPMKPAKTKGNNLASEAGFCCLCPRPDKPIKIKGSKHASEAGFCCLRRTPNETRRNHRKNPAVMAGLSPISEGCRNQIAAAPLCLILQIKD